MMRPLLLLAACSAFMLFDAIEAGMMTELPFTPLKKNTQETCLTKNHPAWGAYQKMQVVKPVRRTNQGILTNNMVQTQNETTHAGARRLETTSSTSYDIQSLEDHFGQSMIVNAKTLLQQHGASHFQQVPWPASYWPTFQDSINFRWNRGEASPAEKYAKAFGHNVQQFMDKVSQQNGVDSCTWCNQCTHDSQCNQGQNEVCAKREGQSSGRCIQTWWGICHAWAPAAILEPEGQCDVKVNGVNFHVADIKALMTLLYDGAGISVVFTGARYDGLTDPTDNYGRYKEVNERDLGPGFFHIAIANILGRFGKSCVLDIEARAQVWNQPLRSYSFQHVKTYTPQEAMLKFFGVNSEYEFNTKAISIVHVVMTLKYISESDRDGPLASPPLIDGFTGTKHYEYVLELDAEGSIIGGEWVKDSRGDHPDFLWFSVGKPGQGTITSVGLNYDKISDLLKQSTQCRTTSPPTTDTPTSSPPTSEPPTSSPPTSEPPTSSPPTSEPPTSYPPTSEPPTSQPPTSEPPTTTETPTTPTPTSVDDGSCGNETQGPKACPSGQYCQPWNPWQYQCRSIADKCGKQKVGIDFYGDDLRTLQLLLPEDCCDACFNTEGCVAYTFVNYNSDGKAYCYLKSGTGKPINKPGVVSAKIDKKDQEETGCGSDKHGAKPCPSGQYCQPWNPWQYECRSIEAKCGVQETGIDYYGDDLGTLQLLLPEQCCDACTKTEKCVAYTFVYYNSDGKAYCYLKSGTGKRQAKVGAVSAKIQASSPSQGCSNQQWGSCGNSQQGAKCCPDQHYCQPWDADNFQCVPKPGKCSKMLPQIDFYGNDIKTVYGASAWECCDHCAKTNGCKAYTFVNNIKDVSACYLKSGTGQKRAHATAVSGVLN